MKSIVYILFSKSLDRFYIGSTIISIDTRLERHLENYYGKNKFTAKTKDWMVFCAIECKSKLQAFKIESHIKRMKSKKYIKNLSLYPKMRRKLLDRYQ
jgi:putative endonuclease